MLSDKQVRSLKHRDRDVMVADGGGLYVRVSIHGSKTFVYRSREGGKARYVTLGEYPTLPLAEARIKASELQGRAIGDLTVSYAVEQYLKHISGAYKHPDQVKQRLEKDIVPDLGTKRLSLITAADISSTLQKIVDRGSPVSANRTLADARHVFDFALGKGWIIKDPSLRITRKVIGGREKGRHTVLTNDQLAALVAVMKTERFQLRTRVAVLTLLYTGQRASEVLGISEDLVRDHWWTIPASQTKASREQKVYLVPRVRKLLDQVDYKLGGDHRTLSRALLRMKLPYTPHDLRRTMATRMGDLGIMPHVIEKCLNHQMHGVMAIYNRAEFLPEREAAWKRWASYLARL